MSDACLRSRAVIIGAECVIAGCFFPPFSSRWNRPSAVGSRGLRCCLNFRVLLDSNDFDLARIPFAPILRLLDHAGALEGVRRFVDRVGIVPRGKT